MKLQLILALLSTTAFSALASDVSNNNKEGSIDRKEVYGGGAPNPLLPPGGGGNTNIITWNNEHYKFNGQCDLVMMKDDLFADALGLQVHIRTKMVDYWSYIKSVAIKIGNDTLEIEGSADAKDDQDHYWINYEYQGELGAFAGFSVTRVVSSTYERDYRIDLNPNAAIVVQVYKEFVRVKFDGDEEVFANSVGLLGDYTTGKALGRDGVTVLNDVIEFGDDWQVLPNEEGLFHEFSHPQFPEPCLMPNDPRGQRRLKLAESTISYAQAELACFTVMSDPLSIKDCVNDILANQDLDIVGAY